MLQEVVEFPNQKPAGIVDRRHGPVCETPIQKNDSTHAHAVSVKNRRAAEIPSAAERPSPPKTGNRKPRYPGRVLAAPKQPAGMKFRTTSTNTAPSFVSDRSFLKVLSPFGYLNERVERNIRQRLGGA